MKGCIVLQGDNAKLGHAIALELKKNYGFTSFCGYIFSPHAQACIASQPEKLYTTLLVDHELHTSYKETQLDMPYIRQWEKEHGMPNLWPFFYGDRQLLLSTPPKDETTMDIDAAYEYDDLMRIFLCRVKPIEKMLDQEKPSFVLFFTVGTLAHKILYAAAKKRGIKTFVIHESRMIDRVTVSESYQTVTGVETLFQNPHLITQAAYDMAKQIIQNFRETGSLHLEFFTKTQDEYKKKNVSFWKKIYHSVWWFVRLTKNYFTHKGLFLYGMTSVSPLRFIWYRLRRTYRKYRGLSDLYTTPEKGERFAFYPLHMEPEQAILDYAPSYINQRALIEQIARSLPIDMKLYIKDHPMMTFSRSRSYYKQLLRIPNVRLVDDHTPSFQIVKECSLVLATTSTVGWEALFMKKPVITFGNVFYNIFPGVQKCTQIEQLYTIVEKQLNHQTYDEELFTRLVASAWQDGTPFHLNSLWYEDVETVKNDQGIKNFSRLIAEKLK